MAPEAVNENVAAERPRLLFIIDNDFGELTMAMLFVYGQSLQSRSTFMLPPRLYVANREDLPVRTIPYTSYKDLFRTINDERPDVVLLFSGYLLPVHQLVSVPVLGELMRLLQSWRCATVTSDPFWGLMSTKDPAIFPEPSMTESFDVLKEALHLSPAPFSTPGMRSASFFNPCFAEAKVDPVARTFWATAGVPEIAAGQYWLFPLTQLDYSVQAALHGKEGFAGRIATMLANTFRAGRYPVLLAPDECLFSVEKRLEGADQAVLLPYCSHSQFLPLLLNAEYVFYWNVGAASAHLRLIRGLPVFSFDQGHIARYVRAWYQRMVKYYFSGWVPPYLDQDEELNSEILQKMALGYTEAANRIRANLATAPRPEELVSNLLKRRS